MPNSFTKPIIFLVGPTAVGKTLAAVKLAQKTGGEIISSDSMQVYKGMDIISSKAPTALQQKIPHHLLSIISPEKEYDVSSYRKAALGCVRDIAKRGKLPIFTGGSGLYISILVDGIFEQKIADKNIRKLLLKEVEVLGSVALYRRLKDCDPAAALKIHPHDARRIVRALEVFAATGKPISQLQAQRKGLADECELRIFCLNMPKEALYEKINKRVEQMFRQGLLGEVKKLLKLKLSKTARCAIGIREIKEYLDGRLSLAQAKELIKKNTRRYALRQLCWFRKDKRIQWIELGDKDSPDSIAQKMLSRTADPRCRPGAPRVWMKIDKEGTVREGKRKITVNPYKKKTTMMIRPAMTFFILNAVLVLCLPSDFKSFADETQNSAPGVSAKQDGLQPLSVEPLAPPFDHRTAKQVDGSYGSPFYYNGGNNGWYEAREKDGTLSCRAYYLNNRRWGQVSYYYPSGQVKITVDYKDGYRHGWMREFSEGGGTTQRDFLYAGRGPLRKNLRLQ